MNATATISGSDIVVTLSGFATAPLFQLYLSARINAQIPVLGGPISPVYIGVDAISESGSARLTQIPVTYYSFPETCSDTPLHSLPESTLLGVGAGETNFTAAHYSNTGTPERWLVPAAFPAGDYVLFSLYVPITVELVGGSLFDDSFKITFRTTTPAIGSGDMNGDHSVNILDSTLLRRLLAGLPIN